MIINISKLEPFLLRNLESLKDFNFSFSNPIFWLLLFILSWILTRFWPVAKSVSFCIVVAVVLVSATALESLLSDKFIQIGSEFDPTLIRAMSLLVITLITLFYACLKE